MSVSEEQQDLLACVKPLISTIPESKKAISGITGVPVKVINCFLSSRETISQHHFQRLFDYFNCTYEYHEWEDGHTANDFRLSGGYTTLPTTKKQIIELYDQNSHGGDLVFAHQLVHENGDVASHTRYILMHTCFYLYTLMIIKNKGDLFDKLVENDELINFGGDRAVSEDFMTALVQHEYNILNSPESRKELDDIFFEDKDLAFSQIPLCIVGH